MSQDNLINLECEVCGNLNYQSSRSKKAPAAQHVKRLQLKKFCKHCRKMTAHKETK